MHSSRRFHALDCGPLPIIETSHLAPGTIACPCDDIGRDLTIRVSYSNHCYTEGFDPARHDEGQIIVQEHGRSRVFCPIRHSLSFRLPGIVTGLPGQKVHQTTQQRNYVYAAPLDIEGQVYEVYFMVQRAETVPGVDLRMTIESAYPVGTPNLRRKRPSTIRFKILASKVFRREQVRFAPR